MNQHELQKIIPQTLRNWEKVSKNKLKPNSIVETGWGKLIFAHTFKNQQELAKELCQEKEEERNIAIYAVDPHVIISFAPQQIFLDPSHTYRLWFKDYKKIKKQQNLNIRPIKTKKDVEMIVLLYKKVSMVSPKISTVLKNKKSKTAFYLVAEDKKTKKILGVCLGINHKKAFNDLERGSSIWSLVTDLNSPQLKIGETLIISFIEKFKKNKLNFLDVSVIYNNKPAISLYQKMGFKKVPVFALKHKNVINQKLYLPKLEEKRNIYSQIIIDEAIKRGINVETIDKKNDLIALTLGGKSIECKESLSELTTAIAYIKCDDKKLTNDLLKKHGINVPNQTLANNKKLDDFLEKQKKYVVKPRRGEQGEDVFVDLNKKEVKKLIKKKKTSQTIIEEFHKGVDLRLVVIDYQIVAAATRSPPEIRGDSKHTVKQLIEKLERKRSIALKGEKVRVLDEDCKKCIQNQGFNLNDVLEKGKRLLVRKTANLHTGGTIKDVTGKLCPELNKTAEQIAKIINIPVVGLDLIIENPSKQKYVFVEANERVGLANHEPQPTAEKFIDLLFPTSKQKFKLK